MSKLVFVTGATGLLGSHIVSQLLSAGYRVRAAARPTKVAQLQASYAKHGDKVEAVAIADIATDQFPDALTDVGAIVHTASPQPDKAENPEEILHIAVEGTLNVVRQAEKAGIRRIVVTSSMAAVAAPWSDKDWNPITREEALQNKVKAYFGSKTLAEKALWEFADQHPHLDVTTLNAPFFYGAFAEGFSMPEPNYASLTTNLFIYRLITPDGHWPMTPRYIDLHDIAKAHVLALKAPLSSESDLGRKRLIMSAIDDFDYRAFLDLIKTKRPELVDRLKKTEPPAVSPKNVPFDVDRVEKVLGMKREDYTRFEDTMLDAVDGLLALEKGWIAKGHVIKVPQ